MTTTNIKTPDNHENEMLLVRSEAAAFTGRNPEMLKGLFITAVVVDDDVWVVVIVLVCPSCVLVRISVDTITMVMVVGVADPVIVTV